MTKRRPDKITTFIIIAFFIALGFAIAERYPDYVDERILNLIPEVARIDNGDRVYTPYDCVVEVSAYHDKQRSHGKGIIVRHHGQMFVLTSSMIFSQDVESINVSMSMWTSRGRVLHQNDIWGLTAVECVMTEDTPFVELNGDPNIPPYVSVGLNGWPAAVLNYINDDWVILDELPEEDITGWPVSWNNALVGIIVGMNQSNPDQAIMVGNRALKEFCAQTVMLDGPPVPTPVAPDRRSP